MQIACKFFELLHALKQKSMELTFKIVLDKRHQKKTNTYSLKLRLYQDRDNKECSLGINIPETDWDSNYKFLSGTHKPNNLPP